jgi:hypothetical protein
MSACSTPEKHKQHVCLQYPGQLRPEQRAQFSGEHAWLLIHLHDLPAKLQPAAAAVSAPESVLQGPHFPPNDIIHWSVLLQ